MKVKMSVLKILTGAVLSLCIIFAPVSAFFSRAAISSRPVAGQSDTYNYSGSEVSWTVPMTGYYNITVSGGKGYDGENGYATNGHALEDGSYENKGSYGALVNGQVLLTQRPCGRRSRGRCDRGQ